MATQTEVQRLVQARFSCNQCQRAPFPFLCLSHLCPDCGGPSFGLVHGSDLGPCPPVPEVFLPAAG